jgi:hypothetical protein
MHNLWKSLRICYVRLVPLPSSYKGVLIFWTEWTFFIYFDCFSCVVEGEPWCSGKIVALWVVTIGSWVQLMETTSCRNAGKGTFPGPCASGSYVHQATLFCCCCVSWIKRRKKALAYARWSAKWRPPALLRRVYRMRVLGILITLTAKSSLRGGQCGGKRARRWRSTGKRLRRRERGGAAWRDGFHRWRGRKGNMRRLGLERSWSELSLSSPWSEVPRSCCWIWAEKTHPALRLLAWPATGDLELLHPAIPKLLHPTTQASRCWWLLVHLVMSLLGD